MKQHILTSVVCLLAYSVYAQFKKSRYRDLKANFLLHVYSNAALVPAFYPQDEWNNPFDWRGLKPFSKAGNHDEIMNAVAAFS